MTDTIKSLRTQLAAEHTARKKAEAALADVAALEESLLLGRLEAQCARALAGDHDRKSLMAALTFAIDGIQDVRAVVRTATAIAPPAPPAVQDQGKKEG